MLGSLRFPIEESRGRRYPELAHPYRNAFQRDRDRILHSRAFRRLENKTQVFTSPISDHFRNRLTHSLEVSQIARTVASVLQLDQDFTEALALVHDFGHPPFAHAGEDELNRQMNRFGEGFDHNIHALRLVESFEQRYARFPGLNLTFEVREGMAKHSRDFEPGEIPPLDEYLPGQRPPLEAQLIDLADEIAYNTADLDDGLAAGLFAPDDIAAAVPRYAELADTIEMQFPGATLRERFFEALRLLLDGQVTGLLEGTLAAAAGITSVEEVRRHPTRLVCFTPATAATNRELKAFLHARVYDSPALCQERSHSVDMIAWMFQFYLDHPGELPAAYIEHTEGQPMHRVVCDYIAGMTDPFFLRTYQRARDQK